jgi:hypothetical protein
MAGRTVASRRRSRTRTRRTSGIESERRQLVRFRVVDPVGTPSRPRSPLWVPHSAQVATLARCRRPRPPASTDSFPLIPALILRCDHVRGYWPFWWILVHYLWCGSFEGSLPGFEWPIRTLRSESVLDPRAAALGGGLSPRRREVRGRSFPPGASSSLAPSLPSLRQGKDTSSGPCAPREKNPSAGIDDVVFIAACLSALRGRDNAAALEASRAVAGR